LIKTAVVVAAILAMSVFIAPAYSLPATDSASVESGPQVYQFEQLPSLDAVHIYGFTVPKSAIRSDFGAIHLGDLGYNGNPGRTLVFGKGDVGLLAGNAHVVGLGGGMEKGTPFMGVAMSQAPLPAGTGFLYSLDAPLQFDSISYNVPSNYSAPINPGRYSGSSIIGSDAVAQKYNITGDGTTVAIVDTGTDFSNPDMQHAVARDENSIPVMLDADGQGIVLTQAKYIAKIDEQSGRIMNYTSSVNATLPEGITSTAYVNGAGVFLRTSEGVIPVYNSIYPYFATPVLEATASIDWKIGNDSEDYIKSKSGIYRFGVIYQLHMQLGYLVIEIVPVLVVDSEEAGVYDTIIPDMSFGWSLFSQTISRTHPQAGHLLTEPTYDFTDERPIRIGEGSEFLTYDHDKDGFPDYSVGTAGARVLDIWRVVENKTSRDIDTAYGSAVEAKLLEPIDPGGDYFGLMFDFQGHGTSTAATVASKGIGQYSLYNNETEYHLAGMAPDAKIIPVKALWLGDSIYGWLYAAGFDLQDGRWQYTGDHKADVISNSWGISNFPLLKAGPGYDLLSVMSSLLVLPKVLDDQYEGTLMVDSVGNSGLGYGSLGTPNSSPLTISVGATTNNVHVGYDGFANITRFGSSAAAYDEVADFSSRGPSLLGDPKPELMAIGSYGFTPASVVVKNPESRPDNPRNDAAFTLFGGTSMAAPMVAGAAALVVQDMKDRGEPVDPLKVKSILMSSAKDLKNDPFVQGAGRVDAMSAIELSRGSEGMFSVYTEDTVRNILTAISPAISRYDFTGIIGDESLSGSNLVETAAGLQESRWFAGQIEQGNSATTEIVVENPSSERIKVELSSTVEKLLDRHEMNSTTRLFERDPTHSDEEFGYTPNYYNLTEIIGGPVPEDADLMVARVNFPFSSFLNSTELFADYMRIASVYSYDWHDSDQDDDVGYKEITMVNRGGSWGTIQELRVSDPASKFTGTPVIGVYPVPSIFSFWRGDREINATAMDYTLTVEFYKRMPNPDVQFDQNIVKDRAFLTVEPHSKASVGASVVTKEDTVPGIHYGEIIASSKSGHKVVMPVSYVVTASQYSKEVPLVISPSADGNVVSLRPNGYVGGLSDMTSRYTTGDWRSYYFSIQDKSITTMSLEISWPHNSTSISVMAFGPDGRLVATTVPSGVFEEFAGWPSNDWLGTSSFSEGGAFFFSQNNGGNSTVLHVPVNQTGTYSVLLHNTLFHGQSLNEPVTVEAKFSTLLPDTTPPRIAADVPKYIIGRQTVPVTVDDNNPAGLSYSIDGNVFTRQAAASSEPTQKFDIVLDGENLAEGPHRLYVETTDTVGHSSTVVSEFDVDRTPPSAEILLRYENGTEIIPADSTIISGNVTLIWNLIDRNGVAEPVRVSLPNATLPVESTESSSLAIDSTLLADGQHQISITSTDIPGNSMTKSLQLLVDNTAPMTSIDAPDGSELKGKIQIGVKAEDPNLRLVTLTVGDKKSIDVTGLDQYELDTADLQDGRYELKLTALDAAGNSGSAATTIAVANVRPQVESAAMLGVLGGLAVGAGVAWFIASRRRRK
jgi:hypothetical protein